MFLRTFMHAINQSPRVWSQVQHMSFWTPTVMGIEPTGETLMSELQTNLVPRTAGKRKTWYVPVGLSNQLAGAEQYAAPQCDENIRAVMPMISSLSGPGEPDRMHTYACTRQRTHAAMPESARETLLRMTCRVGILACRAPFNWHKFTLRVSNPMSKRIELCVNHTKPTTYLRKLMHAIIQNTRVWNNI